MKKFNKMILCVGIFLCVISITSIVYADSLASRLSGKILLQVEENGEAWYINPVNQERYFLGRPNDAFELMRKLGLGIANKDLEQIPIATDSPAVPNNNTTIAEEQEKTWQVTHTFSGGEDISTEPFTFVNSDWVKIKYSLYPDETSSYYSIKLENIADIWDSDLLYNDVIYPNTNINSLSDITVVENTTNLYNKMANTLYHFEISCDGWWEIEVQEYK